MDAEQDVIGAAMMDVHALMDPLALSFDMESTFHIQNRLAPVFPKVFSMKIMDIQLLGLIVGH